MNTIKVPYNIIKEELIYNGGLALERFEDFIFDKFNFVIEDYPMVGTVIFDIEWVKEICSLHFSIIIPNDYSCKYFFTPEGTFWDESSIVLMKDDDEPFFEKEAEMARYCANLIIACMGYIMNYPRFHKQERRSSHKHSKEHRVSTSKNKIYLFDDILKYVSENYVPEKGHHNIQCECWEVRGHYRHYKSGKVVFVKSFKKGKNRATAEPKQKEYYV